MIAHLKELSEATGVLYALLVVLRKAFLLPLLLAVAPPKRVMQLRHTYGGITMQMVVLCAVSGRRLRFDVNDRSARAHFFWPFLVATATR